MITITLPHVGKKEWMARKGLFKGRENAVSPRGFHMICQYQANHKLKATDVISLNSHLCHEVTSNETE